MDDAPRSSKRRKIATPKRIASLEDAEAAVKKTPRPLTSRSIGTKGTSSKPAVADEYDIYDDIEGALSAEPSAQPTRPKPLDSSGHMPDELPAHATVKRGRGRPSKVDSISRSAFRDTIQVYKATSEAEDGIRDELAAEDLSPTKRKKPARTPAKSSRKSAPSGSGTRKKKVQRSEADALVQIPKIAVNGDATPPAIVPDTNDELAASAPATQPRKKTSARRRANRTDHSGNANDKHLPDIEKQASEGDDSEEDEAGADGNSIAGSVLDPTEPSPFNKPSSAHKEQPVPTLIYGDFTSGKELNLLKTIVMNRITGKRPSPLVGLDEEYKSVYRVVEHTITAGEGNSMLVIGARGSGKTALVNKVLTEIARDNCGDYHIVRLNGFIHTDDKIALREIWRQLGKEMAIEEDGSGPGKNYADTLTTLLALLSHPSEHTGEMTDQVAKAVIFVMDEFDLFAQHPRQTLLYNLFDIAQSRKAPIAVLGLTTRIDVTNSLEKRVKSRFSHRYVHLSLAKTFTAFQEICKACLIIHPEDLTIEERGILDNDTKGILSTQAKKIASTSSVLSEWNKNIEKLFLSSAFLTRHLAPTFYTSKSASSILTSFLLPIATLGPSTPLNPTPLLYPPDSKLSLIPHLSTLALSLLIAAARLDIIHDTDTANFNMAYDEYVTLASRARIQSAVGGVSASSSTSKVWGKDVARREWEGLLELGLVVPVISGQVGSFGMIRCDVALEEVGEVLKGVKGEKGLERWCRSL